MKTQDIVNQILKNEKISFSESKITREHRDLINKINKRRTTFNLWQDDNDFFYKTKFEENIIKGNKNKISQIISVDFQKDILIVDNISEIFKTRNRKSTNKYFPIYLLANKIPKIYQEFNPHVNKEFYSSNDFYSIRNSFKYTKYLEFRMEEINDNISNSNNVIRFIKKMVNTDDEYLYIINWLAYFFQNLKKLNFSLLLVGDKEVSEDLFYSEIIKPIFGRKFCISINDNIIKNYSLENIIKEKIFYHFSELSSSTVKLKKTKTLIKTILTKQELESKQLSEDQIEKIYIDGQTLFTFKDMTQSYINDIKSRCSIVKIKSLDSIINTLGYEDSISLSIDIENDLENFAIYLSSFKINEKLLNRVLKEKTIDLDSKIDEFIYYIKNYNNSSNYFNIIREKDSELFDELEYNFKENMIARSSLSAYFNYIYGDSFFSSNKIFLKILREKDSFFKENIDKSIQYKKKKRYTIP